MTDIKSLNYDELVTYMAGLGEKKFRASQLYQWMHEKLECRWDLLLLPVPWSGR